MDNDIKRRFFLAGIISTLVGIPVGVRLLSPNTRKNRESHLFSKELEKYRSLLDTPIERINRAVSRPVLSAPIGEKRRYVVFSPSYLPNAYSVATGNEPDVFAVRDGELFLDRNRTGQVFIYGGDSKFKLYSATVSEDRPVHEVSLLVKDGTVVPSRIRGVKQVHQRDWHFFHLLTLKDLPRGDLKPGMKWKSDHGRIKPFGGFTTRYEVVGSAKVGERDTVDIAFSGKIPDLIGMSGMSRQKTDSGTKMTNEHRGHAWFDLETGLLVRQEIEMETTCSRSLPGRRRRNDSRQDEADPAESMLIKSNYITQLFTT